jgi:hypothetical protein
MALNFLQIFKLQTNFLLYFGLASSPFMQAMANVTLSHLSLQNVFKI